MKKILIITQKVDKTDSNLGFFHEWLVEFAKQCVQLNVVCLWRGLYTLPANTHVFSLGKEEGVSRFTYVIRLYTYIWRERKNYDTVFVHMNPIYVILCAPLWKLLGKKISLWYTHKHVDLKLRIAEKLVNTIFSASPESFRLPSKKVRIMGHGIDTNVFSPSLEVRKSDTLVLLTIGRVSEVKNFKTIFEAVEMVRAQGVPIRLDIIGEPITAADRVYKAELEQWVVQKGLQKNIVFLGGILHEQLPEYIVRSTVFVNMSHTGSMDKVVLESMACGVPVISSNEAYVKTLAPFHLIIDPHDSKALAEKMIMIFKYPEETKTIGAQLRQIVVSEHNLSALIRKIISNL